MATLRSELKFGMTKFTIRELKVIWKLCFRADAFSRNEGDYQDWDHSDWNAVETILRKLKDLGTK